MTEKSVEICMLNVMNDYIQDCKRMWRKQMHCTTEENVLHEMEEKSLDSKKYTELGGRI